MRSSRYIIMAALFSAFASCSDDEHHPATLTDDDPTKDSGTAADSGHAGAAGTGTNDAHAGSSGTAGTTGLDASAGASDGSAGTSPDLFNKWGTGPGRPGRMVEVAKKIPHVQGISGRFSLFHTLALQDEAGPCGEPPYDAGTPPGQPDAGDAGCLSTYTPEQPTYDLSDITNTNVMLSLPSIPVFQPIDLLSQCATSKEPITFGKIFVGRCNGSIQELGAFTSADLSSFFGRDSVLPQNTNIQMDGKPVSIITGLAVKSAICGGSVFVLTNASTTIAEFPSDGDGGARVDHKVGTLGMSGLMCESGGTLLFTTARLFTEASWNTAGGANDPSLLVEAQPVRIQRFDPAHDTVTTVAEITGTARIQTQNFVKVGVEIFMPAIANSLDWTTGGNILFGDHLTASVWDITTDGVTKTKLFTTSRLFTGMTQAPNGVIYLGLNAIADLNCNMIERPKIGVYDQGAVRDWVTLPSAEYDTLIPAICNTGVVERDHANGRIYLGGGNFNDLIADANAVLFVGESIRNTTTAIEAAYETPDGGYPPDAVPDATDASDASDAD